MKFLLTFVLLPSIVLSQDCKLISQVDPFTKLKTLSTGFIPLGGGSVTIDASKPEIDILFSLSGTNKCFTDASTAAIFFVGTKVKLTQRNSGSMNCEGLFHFTFRNGAAAPVLLRKMATQKIEKILFTGNNKTETILTLDEEQQQILMNMSACMVKESPTLLQ